MFGLQSLTKYAARRRQAKIPAGWLTDKTNDGSGSGVWNGALPSVDLQGLLETQTPNGFGNKRKAKPKEQ